MRYKNDERCPLLASSDDEEVIFTRRSVIEPDFKMTTNGVTENGIESNKKKEPEKKLKYPKSVFFIISNEFCERFSYYGMRSVLALYLRNALGYSEQAATMVYHVFVMLCYFTPIFGGIMADAWLGKFKTILYVSLVYAAGNIVLSIGSIEAINIPHQALSLIGLLLIACGTGGIKPCVSSFGGDQFVLPEQERQLQTFFSVFYFSINAGSVISSFLTPMLREESCLGSNDCYPFAFGLPAILMIVAVVFFACGSPMYKRIKPQGNIALDIGGCVSHAVSRKVKSKDKKEHWLDHAEDKYSKSLIDDIKILMKLIYLFSPTIVFWALFEQQGSKWTFQATRLNGDLGWYVVQPDQMQTLNAVLVLIFIPLFESVVYPLLAYLRLVRTPLQKLCVGGFLAALAFVISGILELKVQADNPSRPGSSESKLLVYNAYNCDAELVELNAKIPASGYLMLDHEPGQLSLNLQGSCFTKATAGVILNKEEVSSYFLIPNDKGSELFPLNLKSYDEIEKSNSGNPKVKIIYSGSSDLNVTLTDGSKVFKFHVNSSTHQSTANDVSSIGKYSVEVDGKSIGDVTIGQGGVYSVMLTDQDGSKKGSSFTITKPNSLNIMWQVPQYIVITTAEIMFSITGLEFSYSQSPLSLKSVISSLWLLTDALGNVIILIIEGFEMENGALEMFIYAAVMSASMLVFTWLAVRYKYVSYGKEDQESLNSDQHKGIELEEQTKI